MADLDTLAAVSEIVGGLVVVGGVAFAVAQLRQQRKARLQAASIDLMLSIQTPEFRRAMRQVWWLPDASGTEAFRSGSPELEDAAVTLIWACENMGLMVHEGLVELATVDKLIGGVVRDCWRKLGPWVIGQRAAIGTTNFGEWFQWLAERLDEYPVPGKAEGAFVAFRGWRP